MPSLPRGAADMKYLIAWAIDHIDCSLDWRSKFFRDQLERDTAPTTEVRRRFLIAYRRLIDYVAVSGWVRFTEQFTSAPKLHDKIEGTTVQRGAVSRWRVPLLEMQNRKCFYDYDGTTR